MKQILVGIQDLLDQPNPDDPAQTDGYQLYMQVLYLSLTIICLSFLKLAFLFLAFNTIPGLFFINPNRYMVSIAVCQPYMPNA